MSNIRTLETGKERSPADMLATLEDMREAVLSGQVVGLSAVLLEAGDGTRYFTATSGSVTNLRTLGAVAALHHAIASGAVGR